jgi:hypothetical protein
MRYAQRGGYTPAGQQRREQLRMGAAATRPLQERQRQQQTLEAAVKLALDGGL